MQAILVGLIFLTVNTPANAEPVIEGGFGGAYSTKIATQPIANGVVPALMIGGGWKLDSKSTAKLRFFHYEADGPSRLLTLGIDYDVIKEFGGIVGQAGLSHGSKTGIGNVLGAGLYARIPVHKILGIRLEGMFNKIYRNDLGGSSIVFFTGLEWRP